jgi:PilZ domain
MRNLGEVLDMRNTLRFPLKLRMAVTTPAWKCETETWNVSAGGVLFESDEALSVGSSIEFAILMPSKDLGTPSDVLVNCVGRVVRCCDEGTRHAIAAVIDEYRFERCLMSVSS